MKSVARAQDPWDEEPAGSVSDFPPPAHEPQVRSMPDGAPSTLSRAEARRRYGDWDRQEAEPLARGRG